MTASFAAAPETLTPLVRQLASQLRATRSGSGVAKSFPERDAAARPHLKPTLDALKRAVEHRREQDKALTRLHGKLEAAVSRLELQARQLEEAESVGRAASEEARRERIRADELDRRSAELLGKTQALLGEAGDRLSAAEARAEGAEGDLAYLKDFIRDRLLA